MVSQVYSITEYFIMGHFPGLGLYLRKIAPSNIGTDKTRSEYLLRIRAAMPSTVSGLI